jgi:hypothetical protein
MFARFTSFGLFPYLVRCIVSVRSCAILILLGRAMLEDSPSPQKSLFRNPFLYSAFLIVAVAAYIAFILVTRHESNRAFEKRNAERQAEQRREDDRRAVEQLGGSELAIRALYITPAVIRRGETAQLCYDVANAKSVTLDPPAGEVWPSHSRCLKLSPQKITTYKLTIADASGKTATQSVELQVR